MSRDARESLTALFAVAAIFGGFWLATNFLEDVALPRWVPVPLFALNLVTLAIAWRRVVRNRRRLRGKDETGR
jgi:hypothetical protein